MPWITENRRTDVIEKRAEPYLTESLKKQIADTYFHRFPTRRAALLPALHAVQHEYNWIAPQAMEELAEFLGLAPADVLDTASFYEEYWLRPKGKYLLQVCRSLSCEICGSRQITEHLQEKLKLELGETTGDGKFTLVELECLGSCGTAPCLLLNEVLLENVTVPQVDQVLGQLPENPRDFKDPSITWEDGLHDGH